ncbi:MAG TPA: type II toxin-antitoxin system VapC family toxin [Thermoanaerobaculia bacterium]|nr:type II toxin-antitoxin system VapC family toxin [Thermoanaerobaculia bacterium]
MTDAEGGPPTSPLLLDTHVFLWWLEEHPRISPLLRTSIGSSTRVFVSAASAWEATIKASLGKLRIPGAFEAGVDACGFEKLPIAFRHAERAGRLPPHHRDPFDRMLVAQAIEEKLTLVTADDRLGSYDVALLWAG